MDGGIPLPTCLMLFNRWLQGLVRGRGLVLMEPGREYSAEEEGLCALATWSGEGV